MKKKMMAFILAAAVMVSGAGCGSKEDKKEENNTQQSADNSDEPTDYTQISQSEIDSLADNEFYAANASGVDITEVFVAVSGAGDWGDSIISSPIANESKIKLTVNNLDPDKLYDICIVDADSNTTEYYNFDIKATVQVTFYADAQCDVSTI